LTLDTPNGRYPLDKEVSEAIARGQPPRRLAARYARSPAAHVAAAGGVGAGRGCRDPAPPPRGAPRPGRTMTRTSRTARSACRRSPAG